MEGEDEVVEGEEGVDFSFSLGWWEGDIVGEMNGVWV